MLRWFFAVLLFVCGPAPAMAYSWDTFRASSNVEDRTGEAEKVSPEVFDASVKKLLRGLEMAQKADCTNIKWFKDGDRKPLVKKLKSATKAVEIFASENPAKGIKFFPETDDVNSCQGAFAAQERNIRKAQLLLEQRFVALKKNYEESAKLAEVNVKKLSAVAQSSDVPKTPECANFANTLQDALLDFGVDYGHVKDTLMKGWKKLDAAATKLQENHCWALGSEAQGSAASSTPSTGTNSATLEETSKAPSPRAETKQIPVEPELADFISGALGPGKLDKR